MFDFFFHPLGPRIPVAPTHLRQLEETRDSGLRGPLEAEFNPLSREIVTDRCCRFQ